MTGTPGGQVVDSSVTPPAVYVAETAPHHLLLRLEQIYANLQRWAGTKWDSASQQYLAYPTCMEPSWEPVPKVLP